MILDDFISCYKERTIITVRIKDNIIQIYNIIDSVNTYVHCTDNYERLVDSNYSEEELLDMYDIHDVLNSKVLKVKTYVTNKLNVDVVIDYRVTR